MGFWVAVALMAFGVYYALRHFSDGSGLPILTVLGTVAAWYVGDALYNDYAEYHATLFARDTLQRAWWEVAWFLVVFLMVSPAMHRWANLRLLCRSSGVFRMFKDGVAQSLFQRQLNLLLFGCALIWLVLVLVATTRVKGQILYFVFPFLGENPYPWGRSGRLGTGFDALWTMADYFQMLVAAIFGVVTALATDRRTRSLAFVCCLLSWPYFILDRTRNRMLAVVIPAVLSWVFLRLRGGLFKRTMVLAVCFLVINSWMSFVIANRTEMTILEALHEKGLHLKKEEGVHHEGLNMFEELCWINTFMEQGSYCPNWGSRYFAELVNFIPRTLWSGKPLIGIDYAIARGQGLESGQAGIGASISTGLIGQGVVNFGCVLGPAAAALLMGLWVTVLARLDLQIHELGRLPLYFMGLILTFNLGRDITLITLYPFVFGYFTVRWLDRWHRSTVLLTQDQMRKGATIGVRQHLVPFRRGRKRPQNVQAATLKPSTREAALPHKFGTNSDNL